MCFGRATSCLCGGLIPAEPMSKAAAATIPEGEAGNTAMISRIGIEVFSDLEEYMLF